MQLRNNMLFSNGEEEAEVGDIFGYKFLLVYTVMMVLGSSKI